MHKFIERQFTELIKEQKATIYSICLMFADERTEVDDLVQEALINLWQGFENFQGRSSLKTWVYKVTLNSCISYDRKRKHSNMVSIEVVEPSLLEGADKTNDADQWKLLHKRIQKLGPFDRAIVLLWLEDLSYEEIATIVGISIKNVSVRLVRIRQQLMRMKDEDSETIYNTK